MNTASPMLFVRDSGLSTHADASVACGPIETHRVVKNGRALGEAITNPAIVVEVLSTGTQDDDRGERFRHYMRISSLKAYVLVAQAESRVEIFRRPESGGHWEHEVACGGETLSLHGQTIVVDDIYGT